MKLFSSTSAIFAALVSIALASTSAQATDLNVPLPYTSIQSAIDAAVSGDNVLIAPGSYSENINLNGKNITIKAFNKDLATVIDGGAAGPVVTFSGAESSACSIKNLTLQNGSAANGGGISGNFTLATIKNCVIANNVASDQGGGIYGVSGLVQNCVIGANTAASGGGLAQCDGVVDGCQVLQNTATASGGGLFQCPNVQFSEIAQNTALNNGGGLDDCDGIVTANAISQNSVTSPGSQQNPTSFGGGIADCDGTVSLNLISDNTSVGTGGGIHACNGWIFNNVIAANFARNGGGISLSLGRVENNTVYNNGATFVGGGMLNCGTQVANCILYANTAPTDAQWSGANVPAYCCIQNWTGGQSDIVTGDPMLVNPAKGNFDLQSGSSCIDNGKLIADITSDFEGDPRPIDGTATPGGDGSDYDIGADEYAPAFINLNGSWSNVNVKYSGKPGQMKVQASGTFTVSNAGNVPVNTAFGVQIYLSADQTFDGGDLPVGNLTTVKSLQLGKAASIKLNFKPAINTDLGGQYLIAVIDTSNAVAETDESDNFQASGVLPGSGVTAPTNPNLSGVWSGVTATYKGKPGAVKCQVKGTFTAVNSGDTYINVPFGVQLYLSADANFDGGDVPVGKLTTVKSLKPGQSKKLKLSYKPAINSVVTGQYVIGVVDTTNSVGEINEGDNVLVFGPLP